MAVLRKSADPDMARMRLGSAGALPSGCTWSLGDQFCPGMASLVEGNPASQTGLVVSNCNRTAQADTLAAMSASGDLRARERPFKLGWNRLVRYSPLLLVCVCSTAFAKPVEPPFGVLRVWDADRGQDAHVAGPDDVIFVEVKDFSGWVIRQVEIRGSFADKAIDSASTDVKQIIQNHAFEVGCAAAAALENAVEGDMDVLRSILGGQGFGTYSQALLESEGKWTEDKAEQLKRLKGHRVPDRVIGPLLGTGLFLSLKDSLPQNAEKQPDLPKTIKLLQDIKTCAEQLIRAGRETLRPKINDIAFENLPPLNPNSAVIDPYRRPKLNDLSDYEWFRFRLTEDSKSTAAWNDLRRVGLYKHDVGFTLTAAIGGRTVALPTTIPPTSIDAGGKPRTEDEDRFLLQIASPLWTAVAVAIYLLILGILIVLARRTDLISDTAGCRRPDGLRPYSLARAQMAFWFLIIILASLFLWLATGTWHILNDTCLWLIGIGSGTALGSAIISEPDPKKKEAVPKNPLARGRDENLDDFRTRLNTAISAADAAFAVSTPETSPAVRARRDALAKQKEDLEQRPESGWRRLLQDWLTDGDVYSFHRYQMLAWTLVLGLFFIAKVWDRWELPTFDGTTLALLGITSGTYLGFKLQKEK
jgi:hypothetical protein